MLFHILHAKESELGRDSTPSELRANRLANLAKKSSKLGLSGHGVQSLMRSKGLAGPDEAPKGQHNGGGSHTFLRKQHDYGPSHVPVPARTHSVGKNRRN